MAIPIGAISAGLAGGSMLKGLWNTGLNALGHFINGASNLHWHKQQSEFDQMQNWETMDKQAAINSAFQAQQHNYNMTQQQQAQEFQKYMASNSAQLKMKDYEAAGINPIAAAQGAFSTGGSGSVVNNPQNVADNAGAKPGKGKGSATKINASKLFIFK